MAETSTREMHGLYEGLSRYQWFRRRLARAKPGDGLEMHKTLATPVAASDADPSPENGPAAGTAGLNRWLFDHVALPDSPRVLDIGCGFGATLFSWARAHPGTYVGLTLSPFQVRKATAEAGRLGLATSCSFRVQSYDDPIAGSVTAAGEDSFDVAVSIESLFHSPDLAKTLRNLAGVIRPGGTFAIVEDMAGTSLTGDDDARALCALWTQNAVYTIDDFRDGLARAGFEIERHVDLTGQVRWRSAEALAANERRLRRVRRLLPWTGGRRALDAFLGGIALERLYTNGRMGYHALFAVRTPA